MCFSLVTPIDIKLNKNKKLLIHLLMNLNIKMSIFYSSTLIAFYKMFDNGESFSELKENYFHF